MKILKTLLLSAVLSSGAVYTATTATNEATSTSELNYPSVKQALSDCLRMQQEAPELRKELEIGSNIEDREKYLKSLDTEMELKKQEEDIYAQLASIAQTPENPHAMNAIIDLLNAHEYEHLYGRPFAREAAKKIFEINPACIGAQQIIIEPYMTDFLRKTREAMDPDEPKVLDAIQYIIAIRHSEKPYTFIREDLVDNARDATNKDWLHASFWLLWGNSDHQELACQNLTVFAKKALRNIPEGHSVYEEAQRMLSAESL